MIIVGVIGLNLASGYPADHYGGSDHVSGTLFAFRTSGH
jgi:hypothetical protein